MAETDTLSRAGVRSESIKPRASATRKLSRWVWNHVINREVIGAGLTVAVILAGTIAVERYIEDKQIEREQQALDIKFGQNNLKVKSAGEAIVSSAALSGCPALWLVIHNGSEPSIDLTPNYESVTILGKNVFNKNSEFPADLPPVIQTPAELQQLNTYALTLNQCKEVATNGAPAHG